MFWIKISQLRLPKIPSVETSVPVNLDPDSLSELLNAHLGDELENAVTFLINGKILATSLFEFVAANDVPTEVVVEIECMLSEPAPQPDQSIQDNDWIAGIHVTADSIYAANYGGDVSVFSHKGSLTTRTNLKDESLRCIKSFSYEGHKYVVVGGESQWLTLLNADTKTLAPVVSFRGHERSVEALCVAKDGSSLVSGGFDKCIKIWSMKAGETDFVREEERQKTKKSKKELVTRVPLTTVEGHSDAVTGLEWHPQDANQVVSCSWDQSLCLWDLEQACVASKLTSNKAFASVSVNSLSTVVVTASMDNTIRLWDFRSQEGGMVKQVFRGHTSLVSDVCWAPNNHNLFVSASFDDTVKMWDTRSPDACLFAISGHKSHVLTVDWSYDRLIASGGKDNTIMTYKRS